MVFAHCCDELLNIAWDNRRRLQLPFSLLGHIVDDSLRMESVPHDNCPQMLLHLQLLEHTEHFLPDTVVIAGNFLKPGLPALIIMVNLLAEAVVVKTNPLHDLIPFVDEACLKLRVELIAMIHLAYLYHFKHTI